MNPRRVIVSAVVAAVLTALAACAPIRVTSYTERGVDLSAYRTFVWDRLDGGVPGDPRLDNNTFFHEHVRGAISLQLLERGYEPTMLEPDLRVHYHVSSRQKVQITGKEPNTDRCRDCAAEIYDDGTLLVDLTDARTGALVWRGIAESGFPDTVGNQTRMEQTIERVVERIFASLPRRS